MTTDALIRGLRTMAGLKYGMVETELLNEAADRLEALDERVAIMEEGRGDMDITSSVACGDTFPVSPHPTRCAVHLPLKGKALETVDDYDEHRFSGLLSDE